MSARVWPIVPGRPPHANRYMTRRRILLHLERAMMVFCSDTMHMTSTPDLLATSPPSMHHGEAYRAHIDGLRAVAVLLVLFYHLNLGFTGGYIGVDVFFVISGYLITGIVVRDLSEDRFSLVHFWRRRVHRIIPASLAMSAAVLIVGFFLLPPREYAATAKAAFAHATFLANVHFWRSVGYFNSDAFQHPLLHTWSLAVEEQFYAVYPILLMTLHRWHRKSLTLTLAVLTAGSFALSVIVTPTHPAAAFFLIPCRVWELTLGGLACTAGRPRRLGSGLAAICSASGLAMILSASLVYTHATVFPGAAAAVPCLGAAMLLITGNSRPTVVHSFLSNPLFVFVGRLSYSLYLWHWPLIVYSRYWATQPPTLTWSLACLVVSFAIAYVSWRWIESRYRRIASPTSSRRFVALVAGATAAMAAICALIIYDGGLPSRVPNRVRPFVDATFPLPQQGFLERRAAGDVDWTPEAGPESSGERDRIDYLIWGDSHALTLSDVLFERTKGTGLVAGRATALGAVPLLRTWKTQRITILHREQNIQWAEDVVRVVARHRIPDVILVARWQAFTGANVLHEVSDGFAGAATPPQVTGLQAALVDTVDRLLATGARVWILEQPPEQDFDPSKAMAVAALFYRPWPTGITRDEFLTKHAEVNRALDAAAERGARVIRLSRFCFDSEGRSILGDRSGTYYFDGNHLTSYGIERLLGKTIESMAEQLSRDRGHAGRQAD